MLQDSSQLFLWAIALIVGFPLLVIGLGEQIYRLQRQAKPLAETLRVIRNLVLPVFVFMLFVQYVLNR
ncbi:small-conductance mechanosensitive channel, partial [Leptolyngbya sp. FACHB-36]|nr:small-conductance mechanosensitive channel [Leptolyngbya sp. FACHB-36]